LNNRYPHCTGENLVPKSQDEAKEENKRGLDSARNPQPVAKQQSKHKQQQFQ
jgi:hypothetical protein